MNDRMAMFLFEMAQKGVKMRYDKAPTDFAVLNPYPQYPKYKPKLPYMDRPLFKGHKTYPQHGGSGFFPALTALLTHPVGAVVAIGIAVPLASHALAQKYPHMRAEMPLYMDQAYIDAKIEQY